MTAFVDFVQSNPVMWQVVWPMASMKMGVPTADNFEQFVKRMRRVDEYGMFVEKVADRFEQEAMKHDFWYTDEWFDRQMEVVNDRCPDMFEYSKVVVVNPMKWRDTKEEFYAMTVATAEFWPQPTQDPQEAHTFFNRVYGTAKAMHATMMFDNPTASFMMAFFDWHQTNAKQKFTYVDMPDYFVVEGGKVFKHRS